MKYLLTILLVVSNIGNELNKVATVNKLKKEAKQAYLDGDYSSAIAKYRILVDSLKIEDERVLLNLSNALYESNDTAAAINSYRRLLFSDNPEAKSIAHQQLGVIDTQLKQYKTALEHFKQALKANPNNEEARYNYELLKKILEEQEKQQQNQENQDQQNKDQQNQDQENQNQDQQKQKQDSENKEGEQEQEQQQQEEGEDQQEKKKPSQEGEEQEQQQQELDPKTLEKLKEMNISEEKARMILEAMKNNEIQYLQQVKKKAKNRRKTNKPDW